MDDDDIVHRLRLWAEGVQNQKAVVLAVAITEAAEEIKRLRAERDEARLQTGRILNEIDCRIEHGAESNGHLEAIYNLFKENSNV